MAIFGCQYPSALSSIENIRFRPVWYPFVQGKWEKVICQKPRSINHRAFCVAVAFGVKKENPFLESGTTSRCPELQSNK